MVVLGALSVLVQARVGGNVAAPAAQSREVDAVEENRSVDGVAKDVALAALFHAIPQVHADRVRSLNNCSCYL